jgi:integrase/recombinase XerD
MSNLQTLIDNYLEYCGTQKCLDEKTLKAYRIDLRQLPKTIPLHTVETFLATIYRQRSNAKTNYRRRNALRDIAVAELLFSTGMRILALCTLSNNDVNLHDRIILIYGKGDKKGVSRLETRQLKTY